MKTIINIFTVPMPVVLKRALTAVVFLFLLAGCKAESRTVIPDNPVPPATQDDIERNIAKGREMAAEERSTPGRRRGEQLKFPSKK